MGRTQKKSNSKAHPSKRNSPRKTGSGSSRRVRRSTGTKRPATRKSKVGKPFEVTYIFECTRQGCGYKIVREEKAELGHIRFDLKCPKCHNREFKCLGQGDLPEAEEMELTVPTPAIEFDNVSPVGLGSK